MLDHHEDFTLVLSCGAISPFDEGDEPLLGDPERRALMDQLERPEFLTHIQYVLVLCETLGTTLTSIRNAMDLPGIVACVVDYLNWLLYFITGDREVAVPLVCWDGLYEHGEIPKAHPVGTRLLEYFQEIDIRHLGTGPYDLSEELRNCARYICNSWLEMWSVLLESQLARGALLPSLRVRYLREYEERVSAWAHYLVAPQPPVQNSVEQLIDSVPLDQLVEESWHEGSIDAKSALGIALAMVLVSIR